MEYEGLTLAEWREVYRLQLEQERDLKEAYRFAFKLGIITPKMSECLPEATRKSGLVYLVDIYRTKERIEALDAFSNETLSNILTNLYREVSNPYEEMIPSPDYHSMSRDELLEAGRQLVTEYGRLTSVKNAGVKPPSINLLEGWLDQSTASLLSKGRFKKVVTSGRYCHGSP